MSEHTHTDDTSDASTTERELGLFATDPRLIATLFYAALSAWVLLLLYWSRGWRTDDKLFPMMVGVPLIALLILQILKLQYTDEFENLFETIVGWFPGSNKDDVEAGHSDMLANKLQEAMQSGGERSKTEREKIELVMIGWVIAFVVLIYYVGFVITVPVYLFAFAMYFLKDLKLSLTMTVLSSVGIYVLFVVILDIVLWTGALGLPNPLRYLPF